ncbi:hypothetical protein D917_01124 [Trichinella nativa]|uniref:Uncharacterized protein n=1 Tax=Trichinella nativa TaxID=6335 RepID=A0A1Y3EU30_9BILA|nr:hypothetical protein D917_01124 [Trichinella nativa]
MDDRKNFVSYRDNVIRSCTVPLNIPGDARQVENAIFLKASNQTMHHMHQQQAQMGQMGMTQSAGIAAAAQQQPQNVVMLLTSGNPPRQAASAPSAVQLRQPNDIQQCK